MVPSPSREVVPVMPEAPSARRRNRSALAVAVVGLVVLAGCTLPDNTPAAYDDEVRDQFVSYCTGNVDLSDGSDTTLASPGFCECAYEVFVANVPYDETDQENRRDGPDLIFAGYVGPTFVDLNNELRGSPDTPLPAAVTAGLESCPPAGASGPLVGPTVPPG